MRAVMWFVVFSSKKGEIEALGVRGAHQGEASGFAKKLSGNGNIFSDLRINPSIEEDVFA
jgi:hypothetical protein